jgi:hypothetical protein
MSVTSFKQIHEGRGGQIGVEDKTKVKVTHTQVWRAETDSNDDDETVIAAYAGCPEVGDEHPNNPYAHLKTIAFRNESFSKKVWLVTLTYSTDEYEQQENPLDTTARITWRSEQFQKPIWKDIQGYAITNSAGDFYDPGPERDDSRWVATVVKNMPMVPTWLISFQDAVNSAPFNIDGIPVATRHAKIQSVEIGDWQYHNDTAYRQVTISIAISADEFVLEVLDQGFNYLDGGARKRIMVEDEDGQKAEPTTPVQLNGSGAVITSPTPATAVFRTHYIYNTANFGQLPLV